MKCVSTDLNLAANFPMYDEWRMYEGTSRHFTTHLVSHVDNGRPSSSTISKSPVSARGGPHISIHSLRWQETINKQKQAAKDKSLYCNILPCDCFRVLYSISKQEVNLLRLICAIYSGPTQSISLLSLSLSLSLSLYAIIIYKHMHANTAFTSIIQ